MSEHKCCYLQDGKADGTPCGADAEWELYGSNEPREPVDTCTKHIGDLLDDSQETRIFRIPSSQ
jgi:hypothetical protein